MKKFSQQEIKNAIQQAPEVLSSATPAGDVDPSVAPFTSLTITTSTHTFPTIR